MMRRSPLARLTVPHASTMRLSAPRRGIVVGRDRSHFNSGILMVPQDEEEIGSVGQYNRLTPGLNFAIPIIESISYKRSLEESTIPIRPHTAITKDDVYVQLDGAAITKVERVTGVVLCRAYRRAQLSRAERTGQPRARSAVARAGEAQCRHSAGTRRGRQWGVRVLRFEMTLHVDGGRKNERWQVIMMHVFRRESDWRTRTLRPQPASERTSRFRPCGCRACCSIVLNNLFIEPPRER